MRKASEDPFQAIKGQPRGSNYSAASPVAVDFDGDGKLDARMELGPWNQGTARHLSVRNAEKAMFTPRFEDGFNAYDLPIRAILQHRHLFYKVKIK